MNVRSVEEMSRAAISDGRGTDGNVAKECHVAKQEIKHVSYYRGGHIYAVIVPPFPFLAVTPCKKMLSDAGRQEIKYNAAKKSCAPRGSLGTAVTANSSKLPTKLQSSRGQLDLVYL